MKSTRVHAISYTLSENIVQLTRLRQNSRSQMHDAEYFKLQGIPMQGLGTIIFGGKGCVQEVTTSGLDPQLKLYCKVLALG